MGSWVVISSWQSHLPSILLGYPLWITNIWDYLIYSSFDEIVFGFVDWTKSSKHPTYRSAARGGELQPRWELPQDTMVGKFSFSNASKLYWVHKKSGGQRYTGLCLWTCSDGIIRTGVQNKWGYWSWSGWINGNFSQHISGGRLHYWTVCWKQIWTGITVVNTLQSCQIAKQPSEHLDRR